MQKLQKIRLERVHYIPKILKPGVIYVSEEFGAAVHLCACGCGEKVSTPIRPTGWTLKETDAGPSLRPSIGNWEMPCKSHYWISDGNIVWSDIWSQEEIEAGRQAEESRLREYFETRSRQPEGIFRRLWRWILSFFK